MNGFKNKAPALFTRNDNIISKYIISENKDFIYF